MRAVVQRVRSASVAVNDTNIAEIKKGILLLLGIQIGDGFAEVDWMVEKVINLRIFEDTQGKMNLSLADIHGEMLIVSQFTLYGDCRKGRRPGFSQAAPPQIAQPLYEQFITAVEQMGVVTARGKFGAMMDVALINDGPVTLLLDSDKTF